MYSLSSARLDFVTSLDSQTLLQLMQSERVKASVKQRSQGLFNEWNGAAKDRSRSGTSKIFPGKAGNQSFPRPAGGKTMSRSELVRNQLIAILSEPLTSLTTTTWLQIAFHLDNKINELDLPALASHFQTTYRDLRREMSEHHQDQDQEVLESLDQGGLECHGEEDQKQEIQEYKKGNEGQGQGQQGQQDDQRRRRVQEQFLIQTFLNKKINSIQSKRSNITSCLLNFLRVKSKQKVNCFGAALVSCLIAVMNGIPCQFFSSETHCWIEVSLSSKEQGPGLSTSSPPCCLETSGLSPETKEPHHETKGLHEEETEGLLVDVIDNLKARKKSKSPLSIYSNKQLIDSFGLCFMLICNENPLSDEDVFTILHHFKDRLKYSWEISKYFSLAHDLFHSPSPLCSSLSLSSSLSVEGEKEREERSINAISHLIPLSEDLPSVTILDSIPGSFELLFQKVCFHLNQLNVEKMFDSLAQLTQQTIQLCCQYSMNSELWFDEDCSFLALSEEICEKFQEEKDNREVDLEIVRARYEQWIDGIGDLCEEYLSKSNGERFRKQVPMLSGKRRRIEKKKI